MSKKAQTLLIAGIIVTVLWLFLFFFSAHVSIAKVLNSKLTLFQAWSEAGERIRTVPLQIFPVPKRTFLVTLTVPLFILVFGWMIYMMRKAQFHEPKETALGTNAWATEKDMKDYAFRYAAPVNSRAIDLEKNVIIADGVFLGLNHRETRRNVHSLVIAGSGRGKTWQYVAPNLLLGNTSYVCTDPSGELYRDYGGFFEKKGYRIKVLNLAHMEKSNHYNPFRYVRDDEDIALLTEILIANTTPKDARASDPFWQNAESNFLNAAMLLIYKYYAPEDRHMDKVLELIRLSGLSEDDENPAKKGQKKKDDGMDKQFNHFRKQDPNGAAFRFYDAFKSGALKTKMSILQSVSSRLHHFNFDRVISLTSYDEMELETIGDMKTIIFVITPSDTKTYNFLAAMLYSQLFLRLYDYCETTAGYAQIVEDGNGEVLCTFRANDEKDSRRVHRLAKDYIREIKNAEIIYNKEMDWYEIRTENNEFVGYRKERDAAEEALQAIKASKVRRNTERLPIHVRFLMDEFHNIASIPDFDNKISVCRKYEVSLSIILQSLSQIMERYKNCWATITANCDSILYLGGGADEITEKWFSTQCGQTCKQIASQSFSKGGGSTSVGPRLVDLVTPADLRTLKDGEMIALLTGIKPYRGKMYYTPEHPNYKMVEGKYRFDPRRAKLFVTENRKTEKRFLEKKSEDGQPVRKENIEELLENLNRANRQLAEEYRTNKDCFGKAVIERPCVIVTAKDTLKETCALETEEDVNAAARSLVNLNRKLYELYTEIRRVPHDHRRRKMQAS